MASERLKRLSGYLNQNGIAAACITSTANIYYLTGFYCNPHERLLCLFVFPDEQPVLVCPKMETNVARNAGWESEIVDFSDTENPWELISEELESQRNAISTVAVEESHLVLSRFHQVKALFPKAHVQNIEQILQEMRMVKDQSELQVMREAAKLADIGIAAGVEALAEGVTELEVLSRIEAEMKRNGVLKMSFDPVVLFGDKSADPHGVPGQKKLQRGDFILFDIGAFHNGYCSDITRTFIFGEASEEQKKIYQTVLDAELAAINQCKSGNRIASVDTEARNLIEENGYGDYFIHRIGHGLGIEVHEAPSMHNKNEQLLKEGMTITVEPGIYVPETGGVRIEDDLVLTEKGVEILTSYPKELQIIS